MSPKKSNKKERLTASEVLVLEQVALGKSNAQIGAALNLSPLTVKSKLYRIYSFANTRNRAALVTYGYANGYLDPNELVIRLEEKRATK